jgi:hypothetical protein
MDAGTADVNVLPRRGFRFPESRHAPLSLMFALIFPSIAVR